MWQQGYEIETSEVSPNQIWQTWADVNNWADWDDGIEYASTQDAFGVGCVFELKPKGAPKVKIKIIECEQGHYFTDMTQFPFAKMYGRHEMSRGEKGTLKLKTTMSMTGPLALLWVRLVAQKIADDLPIDTAKLIQSAKRRST
jgi:hypothetical protein